MRNSFIISVFLWNEAVAGGVFPEKAVAVVVVTVVTGCPRGNDNKVDVEEGNEEGADKAINSWINCSLIVNLILL